MYVEIDALRARVAQLEDILDRAQRFVAVKAAEERNQVMMPVMRLEPTDGPRGPWSVRMEVPTALYLARPGAVSAEIVAEVARIDPWEPGARNLPLHVVETTGSDPDEP